MNEYISMSDVKIFQRWNTGRRATNFSRQTSAHRWEDDLVWFDVQLSISSIISFLIYVNFSINICTLTKEILFPNCKSVAVSFTICKWCASAIWGALPDNTRAQHEHCFAFYISKFCFFTAFIFHIKDNTTAQYEYCSVPFITKYHQRWR